MCVCFLLFAAGFLGVSLGLLLLARDSHGNGLILSDIEVGEVIQEPARIEDERFSQILVSPGRS